MEDNLVAETDPLNFTTATAYDALNRVKAVTDRENYLTALAHNADDQMTTFTDPRGLATTFTYNGFGEIITESSPDRGLISHSFDRRGLTISRTDARGITLGYSYDNGGRLVKIDHPTSGLPDQIFTWDQPLSTLSPHGQKGKLARINDGTVETTFAEDPFGTSWVKMSYNAVYPQGRTYAMYDIRSTNGRLERTQYPSGGEVHYSYNADGNLAKIQWVYGTTTTDILDGMTYHPNGPLASMTFGDGGVQTRSYDASYRLSRILDTRAGTTLRDLSYGYDTRDNIISITDALNPAASETYGYTPRESLASAMGSYGAQSFRYDGVGNRVLHSKNAVTDTYSYPATSNRLSRVALGAGGVREFTYDAAGNVIAENRGVMGTYSYTYDSANRMASFSINSVLQAEYRYDFAGRQAVRVLHGQGAVLHSVFDSQGRRIAEYDADTGALLREYIWAGWSPVAVVQGGAVQFVRADHIDRPVFATDAAGAVVWQQSYDPFGRVVAGRGSDARFAGQWFASENGLHQNWMRDYDATLGRYIQADPLGLVDGASVYGYALGNPARWSDPRGESVSLPFTPDQPNNTDSSEGAATCASYTDEDCDEFYHRLSEVCRNIYPDRNDSKAREARKRCWVAAQQAYADCLSRKLGLPALIPPPFLYRPIRPIRPPGGGFSPMIPVFPPALSSY